MNQRIWCPVGILYVVFTVFLFCFWFFLIIPTVRSVTPPTIITYQGKLLEDGASVTTSKAMAFVIYDAASGGTVLYTAAGTLPSTSTISVIPTAGIFSVDLGGSGTNSLDSDIFLENDELYLEVVVAGTTLSPRKRLTASPYAINARALDGVTATSTPQTTTYIPMSNVDGSIDFNTTTFAGGGLGAYFASGSTYSTFDAGIGLTGNIGLFRAMSSNNSLGGGFLLYPTSTTATPSISSSLAGSLMLGTDGAPTLSLGSTATVLPGRINVWGGSTLKIRLDANSSNSSFIFDDFSVGSSGGAESIATSSFIMDGNDFYVEGDTGLNGNVYVDGIFDIAGTGVSTLAGSLSILGNTALGDASGDTVTSNAATWTFANDTAITLSGGVDGLNFDSNTLSIDATNNRVGIGTSTPSYGLTVDASAYFASTTYMVGGAVTAQYVGADVGVVVGSISSGIGGNVYAVKGTGSSGISIVNSSFNTLAGMSVSGSDASLSLGGNGYEGTLNLYDTTGASIIEINASSTQNSYINTNIVFSSGSLSSDNFFFSSATSTPSYFYGSLSFSGGIQGTDFSFVSSTVGDSYVNNDFIVGSIGISPITSFSMNGDDFYVKDDSGFYGDIYLNGELFIGDAADYTTSTFFGRVGINTSSALYNLDVHRFNDGIVAAFTDTDATCTVDPSDGDFSCTSDRDLKTNIIPLDSTLDQIMQLSPVTYNWNTDPNGEVNYGFIAQDVEAIFPRLVGTGASGYKTLSQIGLIPFLTKAIQEQQAQIQALSIGGVLQGNMSGNLTLETLSVQKHVAFGIDSVGQVKLVSGDMSVRVLFDELYQYQPIVTISPQQFIFGQYRVTEENEEGFTVELSESQMEDVTFNWHAFAGDGARLTVSDGSFADVTLVVVDGVVVSGGSSGESDEVSVESDSDEIPVDEPAVADSSEDENEVVPPDESSNSSSDTGEESSEIISP